jgi:hypothetical protein
MQTKIQNHKIKIRDWVDIVGNKLFNTISDYKISYIVLHLNRVSYL